MNWIFILMFSIALFLDPARSENSRYKPCLNMLNHFKEYKGKTNELVEMVAKYCRAVLSGESINDESIDYLLKPWADEIKSHGIRLQKSALRVADNATRAADNAAHAADNATMALPPANASVAANASLAANSSLAANASLAAEDPTRAAKDDWISNLASRLSMSENPRARVCMIILRRYKTYSWRRIDECTWIQMDVFVDYCRAVISVRHNAEVAWLTSWANMLKNRPIRLSENGNPSERRQTLHKF